MKKYTYTNKEGKQVTVEAGSLDVLYEKIKGKYVGSVFTDSKNTRWKEIAMPKVTVKK